ncbi:MAG: hypothetical protein R2834_16115 [Rhodothermales bacterium]
MKNNIHRSTPSIPRGTRTAGFFSMALMLLLLAGCSGARPMPNEIVVEGMVTARGNAPFVVQLLETDQQNAYVLVMDEAIRNQYVNPARLRVSGVVYVADWAGRPFTHLRVTRLESLGD